MRIKDRKNDLAHVDRAVEFCLSAMKILMFSGIQPESKEFPFTKIEEMEENFIYLLDKRAKLMAEIAELEKENGS